MAITVPGLPAELKNVPPAPSSPEDPDRNKKRAAWREWRDAVIRYRVQRAQECADNEVQQQIERVKCQLSPAYWLTVWGVLYEPRRRKRVKGTDTPFIPYPKQIEMLNFFEACLNASGDPDDPTDGAISKTRDAGASWLMVAYALHGWLFKDAWQVRLVSRKEDLVESRSADSLFWKMDYIYDRLPAWMTPEKKDVADVHLHFTNLTNGNEISGEATTKKAVRGGRATWVGFDEGAFIPQLTYVWSGAQAVADSRFVISTESNDEGQDFYLLASSDRVIEKPRRMAIDWWDLPLHDDEWIETTKRAYGHDVAGFMREVMRNPFAGGENFVYPEARSTNPSAEYRYNPLLAQYTSIDPGVRDDCALVFMQYDATTGLTHVVDSYSNSGKPADFYGSILVGLPESGTEWDYDPESRRIMDMTRDRPRSTVYGDVAGWQKGATMDSFYSRLEKYNIFVIRDRNKDGQVVQSKKQFGTYRGRREAMRELWPRLRFADTPGALRVLDAFENHRYRPGDRAVSSEEQTPLHDWTSHLVSAVEYFAVNKAMERQIQGVVLARPGKKSFRSRGGKLPSMNAPRWTLESVG